MARFVRGEQDLVELLARAHAHHAQGGVGRDGAGNLLVLSNGGILRSATGYVGFAIGRSIWWEPLKGYVDGTAPREDAARRIGENYRRFIDVYGGD